MARQSRMIDIEALENLVVDLPLSAAEVSALYYAIGIVKGDLVGAKLIRALPSEPTSYDQGRPPSS